MQSTRKVSDSRVKWSEVARSRIMVESNSVLARPFLSVAHHLVCLVHHLVSSRTPLGLNSNDDIHSTRRLIST